MPFPKDIPDLFGGYGLGTGYVAIPPPAPDSAFGGALINGEKWAHELAATNDFKSFASVSQGIMATQATRVGVPDWVVESFRDVFNDIPLVDGKSLVKVTTDTVTAAVTGLAEDVGEAMTQAATAIPIIGAIVRLGVSLASVIRKQIAEGKTGGGHRNIYGDMTPMTYEQADDFGQGSSLLGLGASDDWTDAFLPIRRDPNFHIAGLQGPQGGHRWWADPAEGVGLMPGIAAQLGVYQSILAAPKTTGDFLPSGAKFSTMLWQSAMKISPQMFLLDSHAIEDAWAGWFDALWKFSYVGPEKLNLNEFETQWLRARIQQSASYSRLYECEGAGDPTKITDCRNKPPVFKPESVIKAFPRSMLAKKLGGSGKLTGLYTDIVKYACRVHRERAAAALQTIVVAYVPSDAPLLRADPTLAAMHIEMRQLLLKYQERYLVEMDMVPRDTDADKQWYVALDEARILSEGAIAATKGIDKIKAGKGRAGKPEIIHAIPGVLRLPVPDAPDVGLPEGVDAPGGGDSGLGWFLAGAGGLALVGGVLALTRRGRRR